VEGQFKVRDIVEVRIPGDEPARAEVTRKLHWGFEAYEVRFLSGRTCFCITHCKADWLELLERQDPRTGAMIPVTGEDEENVE